MSKTDECPEILQTALNPAPLHAFMGKYDDAKLATLSGWMHTKNQGNAIVVRTFGLLINLGTNIPPEWDKKGSAIAPTLSWSALRAWQTLTWPCI